MKKQIKNYRILNLEGAWFTNAEGDFKFSTTKERKVKDIVIKPSKDKLFTATMPYSLETYRAFDKYPNEVLNNELEVANKEYIEDEKEELYTKLFVNFKFSKDLFEDDETEDEEIITTRINKKKVRKLIYTSKVYIDDVEYSFFKRGASKARNANVIFCKSEYCEELLKPSLLGLSFDDKEKEYDITSKEAYTSLIMSGITGTLDIKSDEILIINDIMSPKFPAKQSITTMKANGEIEQNKVDNILVSNNMTDGQALMDESKFIENEYLNKNTTALLRNDFLKANTVRTRLQEYYKELFKDDYENAKVWDMFRGWIDAKKVKLVITPSSCKYLKFANQFDSEKDCFLDWLERVPEKFGCVKTDHEGNYGYSNRLSYQMLNSMNLSIDEVRELMQDELEYFKLLKDNTLVDSIKLKTMTAKNKSIERIKRNEMSHFLSLVANKKDEVSTNDMIADLLRRNSDFRFTRKFKDWKNEQLQDYIANLRLGKIRIKNSLYAIMVSCPYEMLIATTKKNNKIDSCIMDGWECYCPNYETGTELLAIRNPEINEGNNGYFINKYHEEYKWFGYWEDDKPKFDFVVFVNSYNCDVMNRLQGCDWDVDSCFLSDLKLLVDKAKKAQELYYTPVNGINGTSQLRKNDTKKLADLDNYLGGSTMAIGKIVNKSAIFNAYMYDGINNGYSDEYIQACYNASSTLSSCSQIAIDMAKKSFVNEKGDPLSLTKIMNQLNKANYSNIPCKNYKAEQILKYDYVGLKVVNEKELNLNTMRIVKTFKDFEIKNDRFLLDGEEINYTNCGASYRLKVYENKYLVQDKKMIVPKFFEYIAKDNSYRIPTPMDCSMDYLEEIIDGVHTKAMETNTEHIQDLLLLQKELKGKAFNPDKIDDARKIISECQSNINSNKYDVKDSGEETTKKANLRKWTKKATIKKLKELELNEKTILRIIRRAFDVDDKYKCEVIKVLDKEGNEIHYKDKNGKDKIMIYREFKEMTVLTLTLLYNTYPEIFIKCFKEKKMNTRKNKFWK